MKCTLYFVQYLVLISYNRSSHYIVDILAVCDFGGAAAHSRDVCLWVVITGSLQLQPVQTRALIACVALGIHMEQASRGAISCSVLAGTAANLCPAL
jgi:hypothetical protein